MLRRYERIIVYIAVGGCLALVYSLVASALILGDIIDNPTLASAIAAAGTIPLSFLFHRRTTYRDVQHQSALWPRFLIVASCTIMIAAGLMYLATSSGWPFWIALIASCVVIPLANYTINTLWVFRTKTFWAIGDSQR